MSNTGKKVLQCPHCESDDITGQVRGTSFYSLHADDQGEIESTWESSDEESDYTYISCQNCFEELTYETLKVVENAK